jgi:uncharacterized membrane protein YeaQ/YmgE (transglycosylase-associated protein family)
MSQKRMIIIAMIIGSMAGGYVTTFLGADSFSFISLLGSIVGGILGIGLAFRFTR